MNKNDAAKMLDGLPEDHILVVAPNGSLSTRKLSPLCIFIQSNPGIPRACMAGLIEDFDKHPEFYESGEFFRSLRSKPGTPTVVGCLVSDVVGGFSDLMGDGIPVEVAIALQGLQEAVKTAFAAPRKP